MASSATVRSALGAVSHVNVSLLERPLLGYLNLRGSPEAEGFLAAVEQAISVSLPTEANTFVTAADRTAVWLGPDEWLLITPPDQQGGVEQALHAALTGQHVVVTDVSSGYASIEIGGAGARDLLAKGCTIDLHPRAFGVGRSAQTLLAKASVMILQTGEVPTFQITVRRSFAMYLWQWLADAAQGYIQR